MNKLPVYLYSNKLEVILDLDQNRSIHKIMYQRKLKLQKGFKDSIQIQFKNSDQKPISIGTDATYSFDMIDSTGRELVLNKTLQILEYTTVTSTSTTATSIVNKGLALAVFDPLDTINLVAGSYKFVVKQDNGDGTFTPAYSNTYYGITGDIEIVEDGFPVGYPVQTVDSKTLETGKDYDRTPNDMGFVFVTGWLRPVLRASNTATASSAVITLAGFKGTITVEGTLDNNPSGAGHANAQKFTLTTFTTSTPTTSMITLDCGTGYTAVRFKVKPSPDPMGNNYYPTGFPIGSNTNKFPNGFIDQIQYIS